VINSETQDFIALLRLVALVILQSHPLKANIPSSQRDSPVQYQFPRTRHPLNLLLHTNQHPQAPHVILVFSLPPSPLPSPFYLLCSSAPVSESAAATGASYCVGQPRAPPSPAASLPPRPRSGGAPLRRAP
jgi:hypothetical protein